MINIISHLHFRKKFWFVDIYIHAIILLVRATWDWAECGPLTLKNEFDTLALDRGFKGDCCGNRIWLRGNIWLSRSERHSLLNRSACKRYALVLTKDNQGAFERVREYWEGCAQTAGKEKREEPNTILKEKNEHTPSFWESPKGETSWTMHKSYKEQ